MENQDSKEYEYIQRSNNLKQHADKIIKDIKRIKPRDQFRAIWELFQNAVDLTDNCEIEIRHTKNSLQFTHNGEPFTSKTIDCLIKQVSSKTLSPGYEKKENDPTGQYGTGFITTHCFGKRVTLDSYLKTKTGHIRLKDFIIDRVSDDWENLTINISSLEDKVKALLIQTPLTEKTTDYGKTTLTYHSETEPQRNSILKAMESIEVAIPYVLAFTEKLKSVKIFDINGNVKNYSKNKEINDSETIPILTSDKIHSVKILTPSGLKDYFYLRNKEKGIFIILPLESKQKAIDLPNDLSRLFVYYPLIGTEKFGMNFVIHSRHFQPTEPRDGLHLGTTNENLASESKKNEKVLEDAFKMIFSFLENNSEGIANPIKFGEVSFLTGIPEEDLNAYNQKIKDVWLKKIKILPLVETDSKNLKPQESAFLDPNFFIEEEYFDAIYELASLFWANIPKKDIVKEWTEKVSSWEDDNIDIITIENLSDKIETKVALSNFGSPALLLNFYRFIKVLEKEILFANKALLPNMHGTFAFLTSLKKSSDLPQNLLDLTDKIDTSIKSAIISPEYNLSFELDIFSRRHVSDKINSVADDFFSKCEETLTNRTLLFPEKEELEGSLRVIKEKLFAFINYCAIKTENQTENVPYKIISLFAKKYYGIDDCGITIPTSVHADEHKLNIRTTQKKLVKILLQSLSKEGVIWVECNLDFVIQILKFVCNYREYKEFHDAIAIYPNQLHEMCLKEEIRVDKIKDSYFIEKYDKVISQSGEKIKSRLLHNDIQVEEFDDGAFFTLKESTSKICGEMDAEFLKEDNLKSFSVYKHKKLVLEIIQKFKNNQEYRRFFPRLYERRNDILLKLADGDSTFKILSQTPEKISKLASLASKDNIDRIISLGEKALEEEQKTKADFQHKYTIGTHIEDLLRKKISTLISSDLSFDIPTDATVRNVQNGQDIIIILKGQPIYYLEVKSRWSSENSVHMSKNQTIRANQQKENYALCSIDMSQYVGIDRYTVEDIDKIKHLMFFNLDIGYKVEDLITPLEKEYDQESVHLTGDFRTFIPMKYIKQGISLDNFIIEVSQIINIKHQEGVL